MAVALSNLSATWAASASAVNTAIRMNVTDTLSAANSKLIDLLVANTSKFAVDKSGNISAQGLTVDFINANTITVINETEINVVSNIVTANAVVTSNVWLAGLNTFIYITATRDHANVAYAQANTARTHANAAFLAANNAVTDFSPAYAQANTARTHANSAYGAANTAGTNAVNAFGKANAAFTEANTSGLTLLGTLGPFSSSSSPQALNSLTLTNYKMIVVVLDGVDPSAVAGASITLNGDAIVVGSPTAAVTGIVTIDITVGVGITVTTTGTQASGITGTTTASTSLSFAVSSGNFAAGTIKVYGHG